MIKMKCVWICCHDLLEVRVWPATECVRLTKGKLVNKLVTKGNLVSWADRGGKNPGKETGNVDKTANQQITSK